MFIDVSIILIFIVNDRRVKIFNKIHLPIYKTKKRNYTQKRTYEFNFKTIIPIRFSSVAAPLCREQKKKKKNIYIWSTENYPRSCAPANSGAKKVRKRVSQQSAGNEIYIHTHTTPARACAELREYTDSLSRLRIIHTHTTRLPDCCAISSSLSPIR